MRKRSVTSLKVIRLAPSGSGDCATARMVRSLRSISPRSRFCPMPETTPDVSLSHTPASPKRSAASEAISRTRGSRFSSSSVKAHNLLKALLWNLRRPSGPNTATPSFSVSSVADWTFCAV